ncbi:MAG: aminoglycoside phosphotransferase family protein [Pseudomonadota bacterium]
MNHNHLIKICAGFNLGVPIRSPTRVHGGLLHSMWRVNTDKAIFAIKQISKDIDLSNDKIIQNYNLTEEIASRFKELGISAIHAINKLTIIDESGFLVYPWVDAKSVLVPTESQALKIATLLAKIHLIDLKIPEIAEAIFPIHSDEKLPDVMQAANKAYLDAIPVLKQNLVISHGDLDPKNVLWDKHDNPILIDWESARLINPTYEIINTSLDFSGNNQGLFIKMIEEYKNSGGILKGVDTAFAGVLGNWIDWLSFNIKRTNSADPKMRKLSQEQADQTMATILRLQVIIPELIKIM